MEYDLHNSVKVASSDVFPAAGASSDSTIIDTRGFESLEWLIVSGVITTGTFATVLEESDVVTFGGEETVVPADEILGALPTFIATDDGQHRRVGSIGKKRFQRLTLNGAATPVAVMTVLGLLSNAQTRPTAAQETTS